MSAQAIQQPSIDTESEMLPQDPPPWFIRSMSWLLIGMFGVALLGAVTVHLPETVTCSFVLVPADGADPIQSPRMAVINKVCVNEGETVKTGAPLFILRSDEIRGWDTQQRTLAEDLHTHEEGLAQAEEAYAAQSKIKEAEIDQAESEVKFRDKHMKTSRDLISRMEKLSKNGGISKVELLRYRLEAAESEKDLSVAQRTVQQVKLERQRMETEHIQQRAENVAEIEKLKVRLAALKSDLENSQQHMLVVRAPYKAVVTSLAQRNAGSVVQNGQELCQLAPEDAKVRARLLLPETGLPKLAVGQRVRFFFDAFPYQRYGTVDARLDWISPSAISSPEGPRFAGLASLDPPSPGHHPLALRVGMGGQARITVGQRTLIDYAFEPIRQLRENMRD